MSHPPINEDSESRNHLLTTLEYPDGRSFDHDESCAWGRSRYVRPQSTNNVLRPDNTRAPADWYAVGGRYVSDLVSYYATGTDGYKYRSFGSALSGWIGLDEHGIFYKMEPGEIPEVDTSLANDVASKALSGLTERSVQLNTFCREAGNTAKMVGNAATGFANGLNDLMEGGLKKLGPMSKWKKLPSKYLEYLYGWRPVSEDISNAFYHLAELRDRGYAYSISVKNKRTLSTHQRARFQAPGILQGGGLQWICEFEVFQTNSISLVFNFPDWYQDALPTVSPFGNLYEQSPYTFVLDWFLPVGNWVGAMESMQFNPFLKEGSVAQLLRRRFLSSDPLFGAPSLINSVSRGLAVRGHDYKYHRSVVTSLWDVFHFPSLRSPLSLDHAAQGLALLTQVFKKWS